MMKKKYLLMGGWLHDSNGGKALVLASKLCTLYNLNSRECVFANIDSPSSYLGYEDLLELSPLHSGDYKSLIKNIKRNWRDEIKILY